MILMIFILFLELTRLPSMFCMAPHKIVFCRIVSRRLHPLLSRRHRMSRRKIYRRYSNRWCKPSSKYSRPKVDDIPCQLQHQRPSDDYTGSIKLCILRPIRPFYCSMSCMLRITLLTKSVKESEGKDCSSQWTIYPAKHSRSVHQGPY
jgi:hypothetical protein